MKNVEEKYEPDINWSFTASTNTMQLLGMHILKSTVLFIRDIMSNMSNTYTTTNKYFISTT